MINVDGLFGGYQTDIEILIKSIENLKDINGSKYKLLYFSKTNYNIWLMDGLFGGYRTDKEILIKSIICTFLIYVMSSFLLPLNWEKFVSAIARFNGTHIHLIEGSFGPNKQYMLPKRRE